MMKVLHVVLARRFQVDQNRHFAAELVECIEIDLVRCAVGDCGQMNKTVGRAADRLHHDLGIPERRRRQDLARLRSLGFRHRRRHFSACLGGTKALGMRRRDRRAHRQRQAKRLGHASHRARRPHHHAGADRWREPPVDRLDLDHRRSRRRGTSPTAAGNRCTPPAPRPCDARQPSARRE